MKRSVLMRDNKYDKYHMAPLSELPEQAAKQSSFPRRQDADSTLSQKECSRWPLLGLYHWLENKSLFSVWGPLPVGRAGRNGKVDGP